MFSKYKPTWMIDAIYKITPAQLKKLGIKAVLTDLDNTLIAWNVARALKPTARGFKLAEKKLGLKPSEMLMVGDQIMTDIRGANAAGIRNVLVQPIVDTDGWNTRINRFFERKIMKYLSKKHPEMTWRGGLE